jgi:hypothetical protein
MDFLNTPEVVGRPGRTDVREGVAVSKVGVAVAVAVAVGVRVRVRVGVGIGVGVWVAVAVAVAVGVAVGESVVQARSHEVREPAYAGAALLHVGASPMHGGTPARGGYTSVSTCPSARRATTRPLSPV